MSQPTFKNNAMRGILVGGIGYAVSKFGLGYAGDITVNNMTFDSNIGFGLATGLGSVVGATVIQNITASVTEDTKKMMVENRILQPTIVGASTYAFARAMGDVPNPLPVIGLGAGSELMGAYIQDTYNSKESTKGGSTVSAFV